MRRISEAIAEQVVAAWRDGEQRTRLLAQRHGISTNTVRRMLAQAGIELEPWRPARATTPEREAAILARYNECLNSSIVAKEFGLSSATVIKRVRESGGRVPARNERNIKPLLPEQVAEVLRLRDQGLGLKRIGKMTDVDSRRIQKFLASQGLPTRLVAARSPTWPHPQGYVIQNLTPDDPLYFMANERGSVMQHRYVMAQSLGRSLAPDETVHHINGDRADNRLENLQLRQGKHGKGARFVCLDCGSHNVEAAALT